MEDPIPKLSISKLTSDFIYFEAFSDRQNKEDPIYFLILISRF